MGGCSSHGDRGKLSSPLCALQASLQPLQMGWGEGSQGNGGREGSWVWEREGVTLCPNAHRPALAGERQEGKQGREGKEAWKRQRAARLKLVLTMLEKERRGPEQCGHADPCFSELSSRPTAAL